MDAALGVDAVLVLGVAGLDGMWISKPWDGVPEKPRTRPGDVVPEVGLGSLLFLPLLLLLELELSLSVGDCESADDPLAAAVLSADKAPGTGVEGEPLRPTSALLRFVRAAASSSEAASDMTTS